jgi:hypothetical protein
MNAQLLPQDARGQFVELLVELGFDDSDSADGLLNQISPE